MKAITYTTTGPSSVLTLVDRDPAEPGAGEVRVRIFVSGVNPTDWKGRQGGAQASTLAQPQVPDQDGSGVVDAVGAGVTRLSVGDRVWVWDAAWQRPDGTAQELVVLPEHQVMALPDAESYDTGASLGIPALTAHRTLTAHDGGPAQLAPGTLDGVVVLVTGGAGAVSHAAIQLARWAGATVIATVSGEAKAELARRAGAQHVVNYRTESVPDAVHAVSARGADVIVEVNAVANVADALAAAAPGASIAIYADAGDTPLTLPVREAMVKNLRWQFVLTYTVTEAQKRAAVAAVAAALADGALRVGEEYGLPLVRFELAETADAHDAVEAGTVGKVLVDLPRPA